MSYPTAATTVYEKKPQGMVLAPRQQKILGRVVEDGETDFVPEEKPEHWHQVLCCPCNNMPVAAYSLFCCCCAMGDIGCFAHERAGCYLPYCIGAPCLVACAREYVSEKYNLVISEFQPDDFGFCIVKFIGMRLSCCFSICVLPCCHVAQMRAEVAYRKHGKPTVCPCCCFSCGGGNAPGDPKKDAAQPLDYPRAGAPYRGTSTASTQGIVVQPGIDYPI